MKASFLFSCMNFSFVLGSVLGLLVLPHLVIGQTLYSTHPQNSGVVKVKGTSDLQEWAMVSKETMGLRLFMFDERNQISTTTQLTLLLKATRLKGALRAMYHKAHKALQASKYPVTSFTLDSAMVVTSQKNTCLIKAKGSLTLKDITHTLPLELACNT